MILCVFCSNCSLLEFYKQDSFQILSCEGSYDNVLKNHLPSVSDLVTADIGGQLVSTSSDGVEAYALVRSTDRRFFKISVVSLERHKAKEVLNSLFDVLRCPSSASA